ncbi:hypothetical protein Tsp_01740 [Trichinella spiralis]|uniref:hypothetical protein n=1 Tax=Trichinella spiralis TaxID=6334 RepID=UPI0001EFCA7D|nr:hypothetical protein Tsp_01740 [Trichinella spiralis]
MPANVLFTESAILQRLNIDFKGPLPSVSSNRYVLTVCEVTSRTTACKPSRKGTRKRYHEVIWKAITLAQWFQQLPIEQWEEALDLTITLDTFINVDSNQHNSQSLGIPHFSCSLASEEHRRVHSSQLGKVLMRRLTRTNKNDPLVYIYKVELLLPNQQFCLWINRIVYKTQVHPTNSNGKIHGICDANTRANLSTMEKPERA